MNLLVEHDRARELARDSPAWPSVTLEPRQLFDLELLLNGSFVPLRGFMGRQACETCIRTLRLPDGSFWPWPVVLDVPAPVAEGLEPGSSLVLRDAEGTSLAVLHLEERWPPDLDAEQRALDGRTGDGQAAPAAHPGRWRLAGPIEGLVLPRHDDFADLRRTPDEVAAEMRRLGWRASIAFPTEELVHRAEFEMSRAVMDELDGGLLVLAVLPDSGPADHRTYGRIRCYRALLEEYPAGRALVSVLPMAPATTRRAAALRAIVARNHGCTHVILDADAAALVNDVGPGMTGITAIAAPGSTGPSEADIDTLLAEGRDLPAGFTFTAVSRELRHLMPPRRQRGLTLWFTGLSGAGKSTTANAVRAKLLDRGGRAVTMLDGDLVRRHLSSELRFSREHRDLNVRRIGFVASEITKHGGVAICAPISPYDAVRREVRHAIETVGGFVLVFVDAPIEVCAQRDPKGLYAKARAGLIKEFTGVSDPYEPPEDAEIVIRTTDLTVGEAAARILEYLERAGYVDGVEPH